MMKALKFYVIVLILSIVFVSAPTDASAAHPVLERLSKRYFKKNKIKKLGKRAQRAAMDIDLEEYTIKFEHDIIALEPSWMIEEGYFAEHYFNLISTLVLGEYDINPQTGYPRNADAFNAHINKTARDKRQKKDVNIIQSATYINPRLNYLVHLTYSDDFGNNKMLDRRNLMTEIEVFRHLTDSLNSHFNYICNSYSIQKENTGIFVDFDFGDKANLKMFIDFLGKLRGELEEGQKMYVVVPCEIKKRYSYSYAEIEQILEVADKVVLDATNFDKFKGKRPAPPTNFSPKSDISLFGTLKKYLISPEIAQQIPHDRAREYMTSEELLEKRQSFAVMLPYFGIEYLIIDNKRPTQRFEKVGRVTLENFYSYEMGKAGNLNYSSNIFSKNDSIFAMLELPIEGTRNVKKFYVDDGFTLQNKYFYLKDTLGIDNVALNALSYYKTKEKIKPMWAVLALTYGKEREKLGWIIASFLMGFIPVGFVFSLYRNWEVRNVLAKYGKIWTRFLMFFTLFVFLFLTAANVIPRKGVAIVVAVVIIGAFVIYIMIKKLLMKSKKYVNIVK